MPIASMQTQEGGCTPHWRRLFLCTIYSDEPRAGDWSTGTLEHWRLTADKRLTLSGAENHKDLTQEGKINLLIKPKSSKPIKRAH